MKSPDGATHSIWYEKAKAPRCAPPPQHSRADVCVVGAGIAGLTTAYLLAREGKSVIVLDEGEVGSGQTGRTSAHLTCVIDDRFTEIEKQLGADASRICYESHAAAIDKVEQIASEERIDCEFARIDGFLFPREGEEPDLLDRELDAARRAGFPVVEKLQRSIFCSNQTGPCLRFPSQARF